jgi:hypothetical protein
MNQQDRSPSTPSTAPAQAAAPSVQEFYLPSGGGADPDFYLPADRVHAPGRISRWIHSLPVFGRRP